MAKQKSDLVVAKWVDILGGFLTKHKKFSIKLGNFETQFLADDLEQINISKPIYVCGLARSGSTLLLEVLAKQHQTAYHCYQDYPPIYTPYFWNWLLGFIAKGDSTPIERAHKDRILITPQSPEAMEEILWMTFFPDTQNESKSSVLDETTANPKFESFYQDHIAKLLLVHKARRYLAKANYNTTRLKYLQKIFPDALFIIPIREPVAHIASLIKQHHLLCKGEENNIKALNHMRRIGHFEFGLDRRVINLNDTKLTDSICQLWKNGENIRGYARLWNALYLYLAKQIEQDEALKRSTLVLRYEDLCENPEKILTQLFKHVELGDSQEIVKSFSKTIEKPTYYQSNFTEQEIKIIHEETAMAASLYNY